MPFLLLGAGLVLVLTSIKGNANTLYSLVASEFTGPQSFVYWAIAILVLGAIGYIPGLEKFSKLFLILVLIGLLLDKPANSQNSVGVTVIQTLQSFLKSTSTQTPPQTATSTTGS